MRQWATIMATLASHWRRHPVQATTFLLGLTMATALWSGVQALNEQARASYDRAAGLFDGAALPSLASASGDSLPDSLFGELRGSGWPVSPLLEGTLTLGDARYRLLGIDPVSLPAEASAGQVVDAAGLSLADFVTRPGVILAAPGSPDSLAEDIGDGPAVMRHEAVPPGTLIADLGLAQQLLDQPGRLTRLLVPENSPRIGEPVRAGGISLVWDAGQRNADLARLTDSFHLNLTALGLLAFVVGLLIVHSATGLTFQQRTGLLRTVRACGVSQRQLAGALLTELVITALLAGLLGLLLGRHIATVLLPDVAASLQGLYGASVSNDLALTPRWWLTGLGMSLAGAMAATAVHLWHSMRLPVLAHREAWRRQHSIGLQRQAGAGALLILVGAVLTVWGQGLWLAFAALAAILLGAALMLPAALIVCLQLGLRLAHSTLGEWFWAESRHQLQGLSLALMALLLALAANVGVGGMVEGFRLTFTGWLDQRLAAEVYLVADSDEQAERMADWAGRQPEINAVLPFAEGDARFNNRPLDIVGFERHDTYTRNWPLLTERPDAWTLFAEGSGALISEQMARRHNLSLNDSFRLWSQPDAPPLIVAGVYADYGNPRPEVRIDLAQLQQQFRGPLDRGFHLRIADEDASGLAARAEAELDLGSQAVIDQASLKAYSTDIFDRTFLITGSMNTLTLGVAGIALFTSLLTLNQARLSQLAPVWAMGVSRRRLLWLEWLRTLWLATLTVVLAIPLGLVLCWYLVARINVEAFGWQLPLHLFPGQWLQLALLALAVSVLATAWPAWRLSRQPAGHWVRVFAAEG